MASAIDVWERAYYIDYCNERAKCVEAFRKATNWDFAGKCYSVVVT
jgi:superoxide dismutase